METTFCLSVSKQTIVSPDDDFELGFFKTRSSSLWYLGIWYKKVPDRTYVWVANRDNPLSNPLGTLKISGNNLALLDHSNKPVWSTNLTRGNMRSPVVAELLANGNFVLRYTNNNDPSGFLWQSFDFPTDTLLPEMKLGCNLKTGHNKFLRSWRSRDDPSSGNYLYKLKTQGLPECFLLDDSVKGAKAVKVHRSGPWNGIQFSGLPEVQQLEYMDYKFTENRDEVAYTFLMTNHSIYSRVTISDSGALHRYTWIPPSYGWNLFWTTPTDQCEMYKVCGPYGYCDMDTSPVCNCIQGFTPRSLQDWVLRDGSNGCVRKTPLSCGGDGFVLLKKMKLPDTTTAIVDRSIDLKECKEICSRNCNCTGFANADIRNGGTGCVIWTGELVDIRSYAAGGQDLYVRLADADLVRKNNISRKIIGFIVGIIVMTLLSSIMFWLWRRKHNLSKAIATPIAYQERRKNLLINEGVTSDRTNMSRENIIEDLELPLMEFEALVTATNNFSNCNKLGRGGFGIVYKGKLLDGQEIAVKRLSEMSLQGTNEFKNEVRLIAKLQHINLVRLLGCCVEAGEKMLIYEYLENLSLDCHLFEKSRSCKLNWQRRFDITNGIARGLLYLHQDSRCRIIHRDLKASNVLLDRDMTPKISDFGMARIFGRDETEANTRKVVGTYGYMSPEYAMDGIFSMKSDVFSFGVLLLEIISGKRNTGFYNSDHDFNLLGCVWRNWKEGNGLEIVDSTIIDSPSPSSSTLPRHDILRCIQIGLLCVQERAEDRPMMSSVVLMLGSETVDIPHPKPPGYCVGRSPLETDSFTSNSWTVNQITISVLEAR
uniref:Receptor-like serine/threonine-protein kinase n=1 Tax=Capsella grandiflora TaxID=264402 RepID=A0A330PI91_9BRAS|nr:At421370-like [Capsella grandiflora]